MADTVLQVIIRGIDQNASSTIQGVLKDTLGLSDGAAGLATSFLKVSGVLIGVEEALKLVKDALVEGEKAAAAFESDMVTIANNTNMATEQIGKFGAATQQVAGATGASWEQVAGGMEHALNVTQSLSAATAVAQVATESAVSTGADATEVTNLLANAMHEYGLDVSAAATNAGQYAEVQANANKVMGEMHLAASESNTQLGLFSDATAKATGIAANLGISMNDVFAATSALTRHGFPDVYQAGTQVTDMLTHMMNPSQQAKDALQELADKSGDKGIAQAFTAGQLAANGLVGTIDDLKAAMDKAGLSEAEQEQLMNRIIPALRGGLGAAALTGTAYADMNKTAGDLNDTTKTATVTQDSFNRTLDTTVGQWNLFKARVGGIVPEIFSPLNATIKALLEGLNETGQGASDFGEAVSAVSTNLGNDLQPAVTATDQQVRDFFANLGKMVGAENDAKGGTDGLKGSMDDLRPSIQNAGNAIVQFNASLEQTVPGTKAFDDWLGSVASHAGAVFSAIGGAAHDLALSPATGPDDTFSTARQLAEANSRLYADAAAQTSAAAQQSADELAQTAKDAAKAAQQTYSDTLTAAKDYYTGEENAAKASAEARKTADTAAAQQQLDATKAEIDQEKTAYDDRAAQDIKDRQAQTQSALSELEKQNTAANVAAQAAYTAANVSAQATKTAADVQAAAVQRAADESDTAWKAQVNAIKDAATKGENAIHDANDAALSGAKDAANATYTAQAAAIDSEVHKRQEADAVEAHDKEQATNAAIAQVDRETKATLAAIDQQTRAYEAQEQAQVAAIDAAASAQVKALNDQLNAEKTAEQERLAVQSLTNSNGAPAGQLLGSYFTAADAAKASAEAAIAANQAGNQALAAQQQAAADQQTAAAKALADQLSQISEQVADQMRGYEIQSDSDLTAAKVAAIQQQATDQKAALAQQLTDFKQAQQDKAQAVQDAANQQKADLQQQLADFKYNLQQQEQAFKDEKDQEKAADKAALDNKLATIKTEQDAEDTRYQKAIDKINAQAATDLANIDLLAQARKDDYTAQTAERNAAYAAAQAARQAAYTAATADRAAQYKDATDKINAASALDIASMQAGQKEADAAYAARTTAADTHFKDQQTQIQTTYNADMAAITTEQSAVQTAFAAMTKNVSDFKDAAAPALQSVIDQVHALAAAEGAASSALAQHLSTGVNGGGSNRPDFDADPNIRATFQAVYGADAAAQWRKQAGLGAGGDLITDALGSPDVVTRTALFLGSYAYGSGADTFCERFTANMEGRDVQSTAYAAFQRRMDEGVLQSGDNPPPGAEVYFAPDAGNEWMGHDGISLGGGMFRSVTVDGIRDYSISDWNANSWGAPYLGWVPAKTPMYLLGGQMPSDGPALLHAGEFVVSQRTSQQLSSAGYGYADVERALQGAVGGGGIDYDRLAAAMARQPVVIELNHRRVGEAMRTADRQFATTSPANGVGGR